MGSTVLVGILTVWVLVFGALYLMHGYPSDDTLQQANGIKQYPRAATIILFILVIIGSILPLIFGSLDNTE
jgi:magnesium-transporting ATPase (P-type)